MNRGYMPLKEWAETHGVSISTARRMCASGDITAYKIGTRPKPGQRDLRRIVIDTEARARGVERLGASC